MSTPLNVMSVSHFLLTFTGLSMVFPPISRTTNTRRDAQISAANFVLLLFAGRIVSHDAGVDADVRGLGFPRGSGSARRGFCFLLLLLLLLRSCGSRRFGQNDRLMKRPLRGIDNSRPRNFFRAKRSGRTQVEIA